MFLATSVWITIAVAGWATVVTILVVWLSLTRPLRSRWPNNSSGDVTAFWSSQSNTAAKYHTRWLLRRDVSDVEEIDRYSPDPWSSVEICEKLQRRDRVGMVIEFGDKIVAFFIYELRRTEFHLIKVGILPDHRGEVPLLILQRMESKLHPHRRTALLIRRGCEFLFLRSELALRKWIEWEVIDPVVACGQNVVTATGPDALLFSCNAAPVIEPIETGFEFRVAA